MRMVGRDMTITMVSGLLFASLRGVLWHQELDSAESTEIDRQNAALSKEREDLGRGQILRDSNGRFLRCRRGRP